ncbi:hypothetical protein [Pelistega ratti]|uniref:hypothetical protein n=1 Tax=Pelistega ratti TaxID=2652177 RepID=UPI001357EC90|nr:hypothetical protein [Pelistega ratti]
MEKQGYHQQKDLVLEKGMSDNEDIKKLLEGSVDKRVEEEINKASKQEKTLSTIEKFWITRFFTFFLTIVFVTNFAFIAIENDFSVEFFNSILNMMLTVIPLSLIFAASRALLDKRPLDAFLFHEVGIYLLITFLMSLSVSSRYSSEDVSEIFAVLYFMSIPIMVEAVISFYTKSYLQNSVYLKGYKGYLRILWSYLVSLYFVLMLSIFRFLASLSVDLKDLWAMIHQQFLLFIPLIMGLSFIRYKLSRLKANSLNLILFCTIAFLGSAFFSKEAQVVSANLSNLSYEKWRQVSEILSPPIIPYWGIDYGIRSVVLWFLVAEGILFLVLLWQDIFHSEDKK